MKTYLRKALYLIQVAIFCLNASAQDLLKFEVLAGTTDRIDCPVCLTIDQVNYNTDSLKLALFEIKEKTETAVPIQLETGRGAKIWFILNGFTLKNSKRTFILRKTANSPMFQTGIKTITKDGALDMVAGNKTVLS